MEESANKTLADWTDEEHVVYPAATPAPKDNTANELADETVNDPDDADDNANDANDDANNEPADDDNKSEHDDDDEESDKNATPKKEEDESEDESDNESKSPKDQSAVSRDSGLGISSASHSIGAGTSMSSLVVHPHIKHVTSLPLPT